MFKSQLLIGKYIMEGWGSFDIKKGKKIMGVRDYLF